MFKFIAYCAFQKHPNSEVQKPTDVVNDLREPRRKQNITNRRVLKVMVCYWRISISLVFLCFKIRCL